MASKMKTFSGVIRKYIFLCLGCTLLMYTVILNFYLFHGTRLAASFELDVFARQYERTLAQNKDAALPRAFNIITYDRYETLPEVVRKHVSQAELEVGDLYDLDLDDIHDDDQKRLGLLYLILPYELNDGRTIYMVQNFSDFDDESIFLEEWDQLSFFSIPIAIIFLVLFVIVVFMLGRRLANPSQALARWAEELNSNNLEQPIPDFKFKELNNVAKELHGALSRNEEFVVREREFLRQASHELRTPVTVIRGNIELLSKHDLSNSQHRVVNRITRASKSMRQLIETLLWLGREVSPDMSQEEVYYPELLNDVLEELTYFTEMQNVECKVTVENTDIISVSKTPLYIVISNLLRNAFQHTPKGHVGIQLIDNILTVENHLDVKAGQSKKELGQGVGVNLVKRICTRCGWSCEMVPLEDGGMRAVFTINEEKENKL
ncbi:sensor histidine kinase [Curvivirga aplysinae]|uniref:sensor histidine kinase n=1 Tax=Curvivirga aplysinae TaxID=2529852 RepID=UPI0012BCCBB3|nr:HAMP domain-containing sensor histidine kinase [Curvivirga aplysinae]MTI08560.1 HAMP domain-containing histidine kinase [Curvivirga aplysinae]